MYDVMFSEEVHARLHEVCEAMGLTPGLMKAILSFRPGEALPMRNLSSQWRCDASYVTSLIDGLEERGIVERLVSTVDRRAKMVLLTSSGEQLREELLDQLHQPPPSFLSLSVSEQRTLRDLMRKVLSAARHEPAPRARIPRAGRRLSPPGRRRAAS
ncbi:MAG TPA: MarR family transcriptional regulator [Acidimicrobiales bacterium]|nr:MarR family transcriptional regulator [Acidimicrobiales bacterium]